MLTERTNNKPVKKYDFQGLHGISTESRTKLKILAVSMNVSITKLVELMVERLWEEKGDMVVTELTQFEANKKVHKIIKHLKPR